MGVLLFCEPQVQTEAAVRKMDVTCVESRLQTTTNVYKRVLAQLDFKAKIL
jgi:hypothetical protein